MTKQSATASVQVGTDPAMAFRIFTDEIDLWWVRGPINFFDASRAIGMQIEPGVGGRILEVYVSDVLELGRITAWEPGARLAYRSSVDDTETEIRFEAVDGGTQVSVEQTLVPGGEKAFYFWPNVIPWFVAWSLRRGSTSGSPLKLGRLNLALYYVDPAAAADWLVSVFGLDSPDVFASDNGQPSWIEFRVGTSSVMLYQLEGSVPDPRPIDHELWIYVDDLDAHFARSTAAGAKIVSEIHQDGYRRYQAEDLEGRLWTFAQAAS